MILLPARLRGGVAGAVLAAIAYPVLLPIPLILVAALQQFGSSRAFVERLSTATSNPWAIGVSQLLATIFLALLFVDFGESDQSNEGNQAGNDVNDVNGNNSSDEAKTLLMGLWPAQLDAPLLFVCVLAGVLMQVPLAELNNIAQHFAPIPYEDRARQFAMLTPSSWWQGIGAFISIAIIAPVTEEVVFRQWLFAGMLRGLGWFMAAVASALLFAYAHGLQPATFIYVFVAGVVLAWVAVRTGSIAYSIGTHMGVNASAVLLRPDWWTIKGFNTLTRDVQHIAPALVWGSLAVATLACTWVYWRTNRT